MITVKRYRAADEKAWNTFVGASTNGTFLLDRRYMDYHKNRFTDHSLLLYLARKLIAVFPASQKTGKIFSHGGLTYGGLIVGQAIKLFTTLSCFYSILVYYRRKSFKIVQYKLVPSFLHTKPFYQDLYALFLLHARLSAMNTGFVTDLSAKPSISPRRLRMVKKAQKNNVSLS